MTTHAKCFKWRENIQLHDSGGKKTNRKIVFVCLFVLALALPGCKASETAKDVGANARKDQAAGSVAGAVKGGTIGEHVAGAVGASIGAAIGSTVGSVNGVVTGQEQRMKEKEEEKEKEKEEKH